MFIEEENQLPMNKETIMVLDYSTPDIIKNNERVRGKFSLCVDPSYKKIFPLLIVFYRGRT
jgi:hypothetical protein